MILVALLASAFSLRTPDRSSKWARAGLPAGALGAESVLLSIALFGFVAGGVRLLGVGVSGLADWVQEDLFGDAADEEEVEVSIPEPPRRTWPPGVDVVHDEMGRGWVWGSGSGVVTAKIMNLFLKEKINPLIGSAGIASVPIAARVSHIVAYEANPKNLLIYHAMGPNLAGVFGTAISGGILLALLGVGG